MVKWDVRKHGIRGRTVKEWQRMVSGGRMRAKEQRANYHIPQALQVQLYTICSAENRLQGIHLNILLQLISAQTG